MVRDFSLYLICYFVGYSIAIGRIRRQETATGNRELSACSRSRTHVGGAPCVLAQRRAIADSGPRSVQEGSSTIVLSAAVHIQIPLRIVVFDRAQALIIPDQGDRTVRVQGQIGQPGIAIAAYAVSGQSMPS